MNSDHQRQIEGLTAVLGLQKRVREAETSEEIGFILANETRNLVPYKQCIVWHGDSRRGRIQAISGIPQIVKDAPMVQWLIRLMTHLSRNLSLTEPHLVSADELSEPLAKDWAEWLPPHAVWVPLRHPSGRSVGTILITRNTPFKDQEIELLHYLSGSYAHAWEALSSGRRIADVLGPILRSGRLIVLLLALLIGSVFIPVRLSVLAPAEIVPHQPWVVRSPLDGTIEDVLIKPNQPISKSQKLLQLDATTILNKISTAQQKLAVVEAEYRQAAQKAVFNADAKASLAVLKGKRHLQASEIKYLENILRRTTISANRSGIAIFRDVSDWIGKPVRTGEKILTITDPAHIRLHIQVSISDAISLSPGAEVQFFQSISPDVPLSAVVESAAYRAQPTTSGGLAYQVTARFLEGTRSPRIGLTGTAKIYGKEVRLFFYLFRRPLATARRWFGF